MWGTVGVCLLLIVVGWVLTVGRVVRTQLGSVKTEFTQSVVQTSAQALNQSGAKEQIQKNVGDIKQVVADETEYLKREQEAKQAILTHVKEQIQK